MRQYFARREKYGNRSLDVHMLIWRSKMRLPRAIIWLWARKTQFKVEGREGSGGGWKSCPVHHWHQWGEGEVSARSQRIWKDHTHPAAIGLLSSFFPQVVRLTIKGKLPIVPTGPLFPNKRSSIKTKAHCSEAVFFFFLFFFLQNYTPSLEFLSLIIIMFRWGYVIWFKSVESVYFQNNGSSEHWMFV